MFGEMIGEIPDEEGLDMGLLPEPGMLGGPLDAPEPVMLAGGLSGPVTGAGERSLDEQEHMGNHKTPEPGECGVVLGAEQYYESSTGGGGDVLAKNVGIGKGRMGEGGGKVGRGREGERKDDSEGPLGGGEREGERKDDSEGGGSHRSEESGGGSWFSSLFK